MEDKLEMLYPEKYGMNARETITAAVLKLYLISIPREEVVNLLSGVVLPKVIKIGKLGEDNHRGAPMPLQSDIDGAKLATLIDRAVQRAVDSLCNGEMGTADSRRMISEILCGTDGKTAVANMSTEFLRFVLDCYRAVRY